MDGQHWLDNVRSRYKRYRRNAEDAAAQVSDHDLFCVAGGNPNSIAVLLKHVGGNLRARWRDFLTTDGEKRDRARDAEFVAEGETRETILEHWNAGWDVALAELRQLRPEDLARIVTIRGAPWTVVEAVHRNLDHVVYHTGQIVSLARVFAGEAWRTQSIAIGESDAHNARMRERHGDWWNEKRNDA